VSQSGIAYANKILIKIEEQEMSLLQGEYIMASEKHLICTPFSSEQACVVYLFRKRWPSGFTCPFCGSVQQEIAPAYTVVCRYCRKQTSITAHTLMHGSKKSLVAWMRVAWQFCFQNEGLSARELQRLMELSCYQTAWRWLQKIRCGAALAESALCSGIVLFEHAPLPLKVSPPETTPIIGIALELNRSRNSRVRVAVLNCNSPAAVTAVINGLVEKNTTLLLRERELLLPDCIIGPDLRKQATGEQLEQVSLLLQKTVSWLNTVYRGSIDPGHLQGYLDEFCFRYNTASWPDQLAVLDHLLTGLVSTGGKKTRIDRSVTRDTTGESS
jgi:hypothetical protein